MASPKEESESLVESSNLDSQESVSHLPEQMKFARDTAALTMPTWQVDPHLKAKAINSVANTLIQGLSQSADALTVGLTNADGETLARVSGLLYFSGLLISNFHPKEGEEVEEAWSRLDILFSTIENDTIELLKTLTKVSEGMSVVVKPILKELNHGVYQPITSLVVNRGHDDAFQRPLYQKYSLDKFPGVWLELINLERETLYLQCPNEAQEGHLERILAEDLPLDLGLKLAGLLLGEVHDSLGKAAAGFNELNLTPELWKAWRKASRRFAKSFRTMRKKFNFGEWNSSAILTEDINEIFWKLNLVVDNKFRTIGNVCTWILKGIECIRRKTENWSLGREVVTSHRVEKYMSGLPRNKSIAKYIPCFPVRGGFPTQDVDFARMFHDIGNSIGDSFLLEVAIAATMKDALFMEGNSNEPRVEVLASGEHSIELEVAELEPEIVVSEMISNVLSEPSENDKEGQSPGSESAKISRRDSPVVTAVNESLALPSEESADPTSRPYTATAEALVERDPQVASGHPIVEIKNKIAADFSLGTNLEEEKHRSRSRTVKSVTTDEKFEDDANISERTSSSGNANRKRSASPIYWARRLIQKASSNNQNQNP